MSLHYYADSYIYQQGVGNYHLCTCTICSSSFQILLVTRWLKLYSLYHVQDVLGLRRPWRTAFCGYVAMSCKFDHITLKQTLLIFSCPSLWQVLIVNMRVPACGGSRVTSRRKNGISDIRHGKRKQQINMLDQWLGTNGGTWALSSGQ